MFTGIIEELGIIRQIIPSDFGVKLKIESKKLLCELEVKSSISVNGCCLTCIERNKDTFTVDVVAETLRKSCLGDLKIDDRVNLELPMKMGSRLDGHLVQGHVDHVGVIHSKHKAADSYEIVFQASDEIMKYVVEKGSIAVDGISLTVWNVQNSCFSVALIPYSAKNTTLGTKIVGQKVNLEIDLIAKYIEKLIGTKGSV